MRPVKITLLMVAIPSWLLVATAASGKVCSALYLGINKGDVELVRTALDIQKESNKSCSLANSPSYIVTAAKRGNQEIIELLLSHGAQLAYHDDDGDEYHPLVHAALECHPEVVRYLIERGAKVNAVSDEFAYGLSPLAAALVSDKCKGDRKRKIVGILVENGADVHQPDGESMTPLESAIRTGSTGSTMILLRAGARE